MNAIEKIPFYQRKKNVPPQLKGLELTPFNEAFGKLTKPIIGKDNLRPSMMGNFFDRDKDSIVGTDAQKLYHIPMDESSKNYNGAYFTIQDLEKEYKNIWFEDKPPFEEWIEQRGKIDDKYPNWEAVVPTEADTIIENVDIQKLWWYSTILSKAKYLQPDILKQKSVGLDLYNSSKLDYLRYEDFVREDNKMMIVYRDDGNKIIGKGFNCAFVSAVCKFILQQGVDTCKIRFNDNTFNKAMIVDYDNNYSVLGSKYVLLMPMMTDNDSYYKYISDLSKSIQDSTMNEDIAYNLMDNTINSEGAKYEIDARLGFKPRKGSPMPKATPKKEEFTTNSKLDMLYRVLDNKYNNQGYTLKELYDETIYMQGSRDGALIFSEFAKRKKDSGDERFIEEFNKTSFVENINPSNNVIETKPKKYEVLQYEENGISPAWNKKNKKIHIGQFVGLKYIPTKIGVVIDFKANKFKVATKFKDDSGYNFKLHIVNKEDLEPLKLNNIPDYIYDEYKDLDISKYKTENFDFNESKENIIDKKLKVLTLMLTSASGSDKELIEKKIKLLNLMNK